MEDERPDGDINRSPLGGREARQGIYRLHTEDARPDRDINRKPHGGREAGRGHQQKCTRRTRDRTETSTEMHTEDARPDRDINRNLHSLYFLK